MDVAKLVVGIILLLGSTYLIVKNAKSIARGVEIATGGFIKIRATTFDGNEIIELCKDMESSLYIKDQFSYWQKFYPVFGKGSKEITYIRAALFCGAVVEIMDTYDLDTTIREINDDYSIYGIVLDKDEVKEILKEPVAEKRSAEIITYIGGLISEKIQEGI